MGRHGKRGRGGGGGFGGGGDGDDDFGGGGGGFSDQYGSGWSGAWWCSEKLMRLFEHGEERVLN